MKQKNTLPPDEIKQLTTEQKIQYFKEVRWCIPFRELHHTVITVCDFVNTVVPEIKPASYIEYFLENIDFEKIDSIDNRPTKEEIRKYCYSIYYGLNQIFKRDIDKAILDYQNGISGLTTAQATETQRKIIPLIGNLKRQARSVEPGISFAERYNQLYKQIEQRDQLMPIDYQILVRHFNETILNDLLSSYEIINDTLKEIAVLPQPQQPQSQMQYFNDFLTEVQTLEVKVTDRYITDNGQIIQYTPEEMPNAGYRKAKFLDLSHYDQHKSNYEAELRRLQQLALNEFLNLSTDQIKRQLKRLEQLKKRFKQFWELYKEQHKAFREGKLTNTDLELKIYSLFIVNKHKKGSISEDFMFDLHDAVMFKQGYLEGFESQVKEVMEPEPQPTEKKLTPEQELEFLFHYKGNIELFNKIKKFSAENTDFDKYELKEGVTQEQVINVLSLAQLNKIVFSILEAVFIFQDKPFKCLGWIKGTLKQYETSYAGFLKSLVLEGLRDRKRFETVSNNLEYIIQEVSEYDCIKLPNEPNITCGMFEYFTGEKSYSDVERVINGFVAVRGLLKTKQDIVKDFIEDNRNEIMEQLRNEITPISHEFQPQKAPSNTPPPVQIQPNFSDNAKQRILEILNPHFPNHKSELESLINDNSIPDNPLLFCGSGKTLLDFFKQLMKGQFLTIAVQKDLEKWISDYFQYLYRGTPKQMTPKYASKVISGNERAAKGNRLIDVKKENGKFVIEQLEIRNREQL